jgi:hypothetical protein
MHLARTVTGSTVEECKQRMSRAEFRHWQALYRIEPWGDEWNQTRAIAVSNLAPWNKKSGRSLHKFFPQPERPSEEDLEARFTGFARRHNATIARVERQREKGVQQPSQSSAISRSRLRRRRQGSSRDSDPPPVS